MQALLSKAQAADALRVAPSLSRSWQAMVAVRRGWGARPADFVTEQIAKAGVSRTGQSPKPKA